MSASVTTATTFTPTTTTAKKVQNHATLSRALQPFNVLPFQRPLRNFRWMWVWYWSSNRRSFIPKLPWLLPKQKRLSLAIQHSPRTQNQTGELHNFSHKSTLFTFPSDVMDFPVGVPRLWGGASPRVHVRQCTFVRRSEWTQSKLGSFLWLERSSRSHHLFRKSPPHAFLLRRVRAAQGIPCYSHYRFPVTS